MSTSIDALRRFEIPDLVRIEAGPGGLARINVTTRLGAAHIYLHGAHVTHFQPAGQSPALFLSESSRFAPDKAIRGGVPVIFPWFGQFPGRADLPMHGFARMAEWELESVDKWPDETIEVVLRLVADDATRRVWPYDFVLRHRVTIGRTLAMALEVENWSGEAFKYEEALHTYLAVREVRQTQTSGLEGIEYLDKVDGLQRKTQEGAVTITGETDRVYLNTPGLCTVADPAGARRLLVGKEGSATTVVWNPWVEKAAGMSDFGNDEWPRMLCIETANAAENSITLAPHETHVMRATISVDAG